MSLEATARTLSEDDVKALLRNSDTEVLSAEQLLALTIYIETYSQYKQHPTEESYASANRKAVIALADAHIFDQAILANAKRLSSMPLRVADAETSALYEDGEE